MTAAERLTRALVDLATQGRRPRCGEPGGHELWLSDDATDRAQAARWCAGCPVLVECGAAADEHDERHGVWAGVDRTATVPKRRSADARQNRRTVVETEHRRRAPRAAGGPPTGSRSPHTRRKFKND